MTSIIVSATAPEIYSTIASRTAKLLGYRLVGSELLEQIAAQREVPLAKLQRALDPGGYRRLSPKVRTLMLAYIEQATLQELLTDNIVCAGLAAHLYVADVSHILTVRVLSSDAGRIGVVAAIDTKGSLRRARKQLQRERAQRGRWALECFDADDDDPATYDMVVNLGQIEPGKVVSIVGDMARYRKFEPMTYSRKCLQDLALASQAKVALLEHYSELRVTANGDTVIARVKVPRRRRDQCTERVKAVVGELPGVNLVEVHTVSRTRELEED